MPPTGADEGTRRATEQRSLGHAMHTHLVEFLRAFLRTPGLEVGSAGALTSRPRICCMAASRPGRLPVIAFLRTPGLGLGSLAPWTFDLICLGALQGCIRAWQATCHWVQEL